MVRVVFGALCAVCLSLSGCATGPDVSTATLSAFSTPPAEGSYILGPGDRVRIIVFEEADLSGAFGVDDTGRVALPLIGEVKAQGETVRGLEALIADKLRQGYMKDPRVSAEVLDYRPFYIYGEVENGGEYPFTSGMTVPKAVALAGGYTYRANKRKIVIIRGEGAEKARLPASQNIYIAPGDIVQVPERFF